MATKVKEIRRPRGFIRFLFRTPNWFFEHGLGKLFGRRFVQLQHIGRRSGRDYHTVVEVVKSDPDTGRIYVCAAFGEDSDWYRNVIHHPQIKINFTGREYDARVTELSPAQGVDILVDYARRYPLAARELSEIMGYKTDGTPQDFGQLAKDLPVLEIKFK